MVVVKGPAIKYGAYLGFAIICWLLPSSANFPPLFAIICLLTAIVAFVYASVEGRGLVATLKTMQINHRASETFDHHVVATRTHYAMEAATRDIELEFMSPTPVYPGNPVYALPAAQAATMDETTQAFLDQLVELSKEIGWLSASTVKRRKKSFRQFEPDQIRDFFKELADHGIGRIKGLDNSMEWIWDTDQNGN